MRRTLLSGLAAAVLALSCGGDGPSGPPPAVPGVATVVLDGTQAQDEALLIEIRGGATGVSAARGDLEVYSRERQGDLVVAVFGPLSGGPLLTVNVADVASLPTLVIREVADESGGLRSLTGYGAAFQDIR